METCHYDNRFNIQHSQFSVINLYHFVLTYFVIQLSYVYKYRMYSVCVDIKKIHCWSDDEATVRSCAVLLTFQSISQR